VGIIGNDRMVFQRSSALAVYEHGYLDLVHRRMDFLEIQPVVSNLTTDVKSDFFYKFASLNQSSYGKRTRQTQRRQKEASENP
jgi:hypothetical protein